MTRLLAALACLVVLLASCRTDAGFPSAPEEDDVAGLLARWNAAVASTPAVSGDFHWKAVDQFPHPTFRGGSQAAYTGFVDILLTLYSRPDNLDFMESHTLFDEPFTYGSAPEVTFRSFARFLSTFSLVAPDRQARLVAVCASPPFPC